MKQEIEKKIKKDQEPAEAAPKPDAGHRAGMELLKY